MNEYDRAYVEGFVQKCAEAGVDPEKVAQFMSQARQAWDNSQQKLDNVPYLGAARKGLRSVGQQAAGYAGRVGGITAGAYQNGVDAVQQPYVGGSGPFRKGPPPDVRAIGAAGRFMGGYTSHMAGPGANSMSGPTAPGLSAGFAQGRAQVRGLGR